METGIRQKLIKLLNDKYNEMSDSLATINLELGRIRNNFINANDVIDSSQNVKCNNLLCDNIVLTGDTININNNLSFTGENNDVIIDINDNHSVEFNVPVYINDIIHTYDTGKSIDNSVDISTSVDTLLNSINIGQTTDNQLYFGSIKNNVLGYDSNNKNINLMTLLLAILYKLKEISTKKDVYLLS